MEPVRERRTPEWLANVMRQENGVDAKLICEKYLTRSDVSKNMRRFLIPFNSIEDMDFLNEEELNMVGEGVEVILVDPRGVRWVLNLRRWTMHIFSHYVLVSGWNNVTLQNGLQKDQRIRLWSFHSPEGLYFALVPPAPAPAPDPAPLEA